MGKNFLFLIVAAAAGLLIAASNSGCTQTIVREREYADDGGVNFTPDLAASDLGPVLDMYQQNAGDLPRSTDLLGSPDLASALSFNILDVSFDFLDKGNDTYDITATDGNVDDVWVKATRLDTNKLVFDIWQLYTLTSATTTNVSAPHGSVWRFEVWTWAVNGKLERDGCIAVWTQRCYKQYDLRNFKVN